MLNKGITLGIFPGISVFIIGAVWIFYFFYNLYQIRAGKMRELSERVGAFLILLGGAGNLASRVLYGGVVDNFNFFGFMNNNICDYAIWGGLIIVFFSTHKSWPRRA